MNNLNFDWDAIRVFLSVAEHNSLSRAAVELSLSQPTVGRHIARLEEQLDVTLFDRRQTGYFLTPAGRRLVKASQSMARGAADFRRAVDLERADSPDQVCRITLGEWGQHYLSQHIDSILTGLPGVRLELHADDAFWDLSRNSADIAIGNRPPRQAHLIARKLGEISFHVYASTTYLETHPEAFDPETWLNQIWAGYCGSRARLRSSQLLAEILHGRSGNYAVNNSVALFMILQSGHAMGILPDWIAEAEGLVRLTDTPLATTESWISFHEQLRYHPKLADVKDRITQLYQAHFQKTAAWKERNGSPARGSSCKTK
ncbi:LysR family transcriptional regulator [Roseibium sp.]|uniref:LysR family transcriptional regulator n=1 Tax=Roseibium sp. TaxID=1936156 RepID=UPI003D1380FF